MANNNNWRNFGGIYKNDNLSHISVGTIIADELRLRNSSSSELTVPGSLKVARDAFITGNATISSDAIFKSNIYFGNTVSPTITNTYLAGSATGAPSGAAPDAVSACFADASLCKVQEVGPSRSDKFKLGMQASGHSR